MIPRFLRLLPLMLIVFAACNKEPEAPSKQEIQRRIDSLTQERIKESDDRARQDLLRRMKIEVKVKVDSIVNAQLHPVLPDTNKPKRIQPAAMPFKPIMPRPAK